MTFRTAAGEASIREMASKVPSILVGADTVTSVEVARRAVDAGARYIVTPGYDRTAVKWCIDHEVPIPPAPPPPARSRMPRTMDSRP